MFEALFRKAKQPVEQTAFCRVELASEPVWKSAELQSRLHADPWLFQKEELSHRQRVALGAGTAFDDDASAKVSSGFGTSRMLSEHGVRVGNILAAQLSPRDLMRLSLVEGVECFAKLGFDSLHLAEYEDFAQELTELFGTDEVRRVFVTMAADAVAVAASRVQTMLGLGVSDLLSLCAGQPDEACAVLEQLAPKAPVAFKGLQGPDLVACAVTIHSLARVGVSLGTLMSLRIDHKSLTTLGFRF